MAPRKEPRQHRVAPVCLSRPMCFDCGSLILADVWFGAPHRTCRIRHTRLRTLFGSIQQYVRQPQTVEGKPCGPRDEPAREAYQSSSATNKCRRDEGDVKLSKSRFRRDEPKPPDRPHVALLQRSAPWRNAWCTTLQDRGSPFRVKTWPSPLGDTAQCLVRKPQHRSTSAAHTDIRVSYVMQTRR
jgi:hypothetical protein